MSDGLEEALHNLYTGQIMCHLYQVLCEDLPSCGCGWPGEANRLVHAVLSLMPTYGTEKKRQLAALIGPEGSQQIVLCALNEAGLIRHGVSVDSADLAPLGRWVLWAVEQVGGIDVVVRGLDEAGFPHDDRECTDACWAVPEGWEPHPVDEPPPSGRAAAEDSTSMSLAEITNFLGVEDRSEGAGCWPKPTFTGILGFLAEGGEQQ